MSSCSRFVSSATGLCSLQTEVSPALTEMEDQVTAARLQQQEQEIQRLSAEIKSLKNPQNLNSSECLEDLREENTRLKYRINILKRCLLEEEKNRSSPSMMLLSDP